MPKLNPTQIRQQLKILSNGNEEYAIFSKKIVNTEKKVIGVRIPDLRKLAKNLSKDLNFEDVQNFLEICDKNNYEEVILSGLLINYIKITDLEKISLTKEYLKYVDSWGLVDIFVEKIKKFDKDLYWNFVIECLKSDEEFTIRFGVIFLMSNFLNDEYIGKVFKELRKIENNAYYVKMALAWLYATSAINYFEKTIVEITRPDIDVWITKKSFQKMLESFRISEEHKKKIRELREEM